MIIAEFSLDHPVCRHTMQRVPTAETRWENAYTTPDDRMQMFVWITSGDFAAIDSALDEDPTIANPEVLTEMSDRRLYRLDYRNRGRETSLVPVLYEHGGLIREAIGTGEGWQYQIQFPDRRAFQQLYEFCCEHEIDFTFHRLYEQSEWTIMDHQKLTDPQRETLIQAVGDGYFDIPRGCSLAELGERLGISESAASERLRRGVKNLVEQTIYP